MSHLTTIAARERDLYANLWADVPSYSAQAPGATHVGTFTEMSGAAGGASVLDAGCGSGAGALALQAAGYRVTLCDVTPAGVSPEASTLPFVAACLWHDLAPVAYLSGGVDYVYCTDVLEHIPPEYTMLVLSRLLEASKSGVFLNISLVPDQFGVWVGQPLHQTVRPFTWWRDRLRDLGQLVECRDLLVSGVYFVRPR
jgi:SAM-dependent methyltransferase